MRNELLLVGILCSGVAGAAEAGARTRAETLAADYDAHRFRAVPRDAFPAFHDPELASAAAANAILRDNEWVIGVAWAATRGPTRWR